MHVQEIGFAVQEENGIVTRIGKSAICQPGTGSKGSMGRLHDVPRNGHTGQKPGRARVQKDGSGIE